MVYESKGEPPLPRAHFARRFGLHLAFAFGLVAFSLGIGMLGYAEFEHLPWIDAFLNAARQQTKAKWDVRYAAKAVVSYETGGFVVVGQSGPE